ncbi:FK506 binding protein proline rotamase rapamycin-binding protein [Cadophora gregata]|nr:FK506 binding protein proline rotamase rapamycin-binding protein [Cadophora gregata]KAK0112812.1 FK506 binding protein proline rotamase rapamycin-binding protein [Cadophora gregata]KAK0124935.1 FK506 binding protein proline rotamase rapamycin-binding protein [Cadophora gregata f. sp. sojae]
MFSSSASRLLRFARPSLPTTTTTSSIRSFSRTSAAMGVTKTVLKEGDGAIPKVGDRVTIEYTGYLKDTSKPENKGDKFDSSIGRGAFVTEIGIGRVIKGWDEGVTTMKVGEKATLDITSDFAYGDRGFPGHIPAKADLIFDVELQKIN